MPAMNVTPSPMPAPVSSNAPVQASQAANAADSGADNGKQANFANALDGAKAKTQKAESAKAAERSDAEETAPADDPARLAQIAAALLASLGAPINDKAVTAAQPEASEGTQPTLGISNGTALPLDGKALPAAAVPAVQGSESETSADTSDKGAPANPLLAQTANRATPASSEDKPAPAITASGDAAKQPLAAAVTEAADKTASSKAIVTETTAQVGGSELPPISHWADTQANRTAALTRTEAPQFPVRTPVSQSGWADDVGNRMVWMAGKELGRAELILTPPHLGRVEITLNVNGDQTTAQFVTATPAAREAIEQSIPRLRELMTEAGLNLGQVNVSANGTNDPSQEQRSWGGAQRGGRQAMSEETSEIVGQPRSMWVQSGRGMVDTFA